MAGVHDFEKPGQGQPCRSAVLIRGDVDRGNGPKLSSTRQVLRGIDLLLFAGIGIVIGGPVWVGVSVVAASRIHQIATKTDQCPILAC